jgi:uncharacterized membrane protein YeaQ/YmgE (transglycosylase-associated protein family)
MGILLWVLFGALVGWTFSRFVPAEYQDVSMDIWLGIFGALIAGWISTIAGFGPTLLGLNLPTLFISVVGAVSLLASVRYVKARMLNRL